MLLHLLLDCRRRNSGLIEKQIQVMDVQLQKWRDMRKATFYHISMLAKFEHRALIFFWIT